MARKRWTPAENVNNKIQNTRQKKKWQIALRRYLLEGQKSTQYAPYFGLDASLFRQWIEVQFDEHMNWDNFSAVWQLDHVIPTHYFNLEDEQDLKLCWNFINIRPGNIQDSEGPSKVDALTAKAYFTNLFEHTGLAQCGEMLEKIKIQEAAQQAAASKTAQFLSSHKEQIETMRQWDAADFERLNTGISFKDLAFEKTFFKKFA
ncbi:hypothetical protein [Pseudocnuella soli]|uniref:hypothetical protein n=1 Tax=Pseudocnuella soli TaxID=2502779 RepID=UPI0010462993|nr:hypothetical protein [Pseudocnuella soli]